MSKITVETENRPHECGRSPEEKVLYPDPDALRTVNHAAPVSTGEGI